MCLSNWDIIFESIRERYVDRASFAEKMRKASEYCLCFCYESEVLNDVSQCSLADSPQYRTVYVCVLRWRRCHSQRSLDGPTAVGCVSLSSCTPATHTDCTSPVAYHAEPAGVHKEMLSSEITRLLQM